MLELVGAGVVSFAAAFLGTVSGGGGLLTIPYLLLTGVPVDTAIATNRLGGLAMIVGSMHNFYRSKKINFKLVPVLSVIAAFGGLIGADLVLNIDDRLLETIAGFLLLCLLPTIFVRKNFGLKEVKKSFSSKLGGLVLYFVGMIFGGFFGAGAGIFLNYILVNFFGLTFLRAVATDIVAWAFMSVVSFSIFAFSGLIDYRIGSCMVIGSLVGGYAGSKTAITKGNRFIKIITVFVIVATSVKLLLF